MRRAWLVAAVVVSMTSAAQAGNDFFAHAYGLTTGQAIDGSPGAMLGTQQYRATHGGASGPGNYQPDIDGALPHQTPACDGVYDAYLETNPDVVKQAQRERKPTRDFAFHHYRQFGQREGRAVTDGTCFQ